MRLFYRCYIIRLFCHSIHYILESTNFLNDFLFAYIKVHSCAMDFDKGRVSCIYHSSIIHNTYLHKPLPQPKPTCPQTQSVPCPQKNSNCSGKKILRGTISSYFQCSTLPSTSLLGFFSPCSFPYPPPATSSTLKKGFFSLSHPHIVGVHEQARCTITFFKK